MAQGKSMVQSLRFNQCCSLITVQLNLLEENPNGKGSSMNNLERFKKVINWEPIDRILTYDYLDNKQLLIEYGGFDASNEYSFEALIEINARAWQKIGLDVTRSVYDPINHWMGGKIKNWIRGNGKLSRLERRPGFRSVLSGT
jgi:hypothetical protein